MNWFIGKGYNISDQKDFNGRPFLTYQGPNDKIPITLYDRVAQTFDFTIAQPLKAGAMTNDRFDSSTASAIKSILGGGSNDELDHKISLELGGSNSPANLWIQPGINNGASAASDTLENNLALDVVNGKISLETAWETLSQQKGFLMAENIIFTPTLDQTSFLNIAKTVIKSTNFNLVSLLNPLSIGGVSLSSFFGGTPITQIIQPVNTQLKSQLDADIALLKQTPLNQPLLTKIFKEQVTLTAQQLQISDKEAGKTVSTYLAGYAQSKGIDAKGMMGAMNADIQKIIDASNSDPNVLGISSTTITKIVIVLQTLSTTLVGAGVTLAVIGIFLAGPTAVLSALSGGLLESIGAIFGVSALTGIGLTSFALGETFNVASIGLNMSVKATYDNQYLLPTQQIQAMHNALAIQKGLAGFLPSTVNTNTPQGTGTGAGSTGGTVIPKTQVFTGVVSSGVLGTGLNFTPRVSSIISTSAELQDAVHNNLAPYLAALPSKLVYDIKITAHIVNSDGVTQRGTTQRILKGHTKKGIPEYKTVTNKFAVLDIYVLTDKGQRTKITTINLGPTDSATLNPSASDLTSLSGVVQGSISTSNTDNINTLVSNTPTATPTQAQNLIANTNLSIATQFTKYNIKLGHTQAVGNAPERWVLDESGAFGNPPGAREITAQEAATLRADGIQQIELPTGLTQEQAPSLGFGGLASGISRGNIGLTAFLQNVLQGYQALESDVTGIKTVTPQQTTGAVATGAVAGAITTPTTAQILNKLGATATTLFDWYTANNKTFPSVAQRATLYQTFGLGPSNLYVGSAEQNTELLTKLKKN